MRRAPAILAIIISLTGIMGFIGGVDLEGVITSGVFGVALLASGIATLLGWDLIYLATSWGIYIGMNLAAYVDVIAAMRNQQSPMAVFLTALLIVGIVGLLLTLIARQKEIRS